MAKLTLTDKKRFKALLKTFDASKKAIAKERDKAREVCDEMESILATVDEGLDLFEGGLRDLRSGLDEISQHL